MPGGWTSGRKASRWGREEPRSGTWGAPCGCSSGGGQAPTGLVSGDGAGGEMWASKCEEAALPRDVDFILQVRGKTADFLEGKSGMTSSRL